ncbi:MAG TPA: vWA domain-containing protein [Minicystis sp.]|nr:vWA domain-containing protein [Minicystis sp.]
MLPFDSEKSAAPREPKSSRRLGRAPLAAALGLGLALGVGAIGAGCGKTQGSGGAGGFGEGGSGSGNGHPASTGAAGGLSGGGFNPATGSSTGSGADPDAACATSSSEASLIPVAMYIMFDDSGSMSQNNKWNDASAALNAFFADPGSAGLKVALRFFPDGACSDNQCDANACATPAVAMGALTAESAPQDAQEQFLTDVTNAHGPTNGGGTPLYSALEGAEQFAMSYQSAHPDEKAVVILVTDGAPNGCDNNVNDIAQWASQANMQAGILTFAVGLQGSNTQAMNQFAQAGGTGQAFFIGTGTDAEQQLLMALQAIRGQSVSCDFTLPSMDSHGDPIDPSKVNVDYTPGSGGMDETFPQVPNAAACGNGDGWYYDNPQAPTKITLCPHTCQTVQADAGAKIQIIFGCATKVPS